MQNRRHFISKTMAASLAFSLSSINKLAAFTSNNTNVNILLGRPTNTSITLNVFSSNNAEVYVEYGNNSSQLTNKTTSTTLLKNIPKEVLLDGLQANTRYYYRLCIVSESDKRINKGTVYSFHTQRSKDSDFIFTITADSHLGTLKHCDPQLYQLTLNNVAKDNPDLHFALGDEFRASKVQNPNYNSIEQLYFAQRAHLGTLCTNVPYFFILGNHELEAKAYYDGTDNCLAAWSANARKKFVPNPLPNHFYSGNIASNPLEDKRQNYYAFEWGNVLFVTLDVFWYSNISAEDEEMRAQAQKRDDGLTKEERMKARQEEKGKNKQGGNKHKDQWAFTIGDEQYQWLQRTLAQSKAKYKFVLGHHVMGSCRGAVEWADKFEWGGNNRKGNNEFATNRPNWQMPIHQLFVKHQVTAFIQGHDHLFARQDLDGIAYITCPMCADPGYNTYNADGYLSGDKLSNTGHLKMIVSAKDVQMQYIKAVLPKDETAQGKNGAIAYAWSFTNKQKLTV